jgi:hypothetical protein
MRRFPPESGDWAGRTRTCNPDSRAVDQRQTVPVVPLDSGREAVEDRRSADREEKPMDDLAIQRRVERTIHQCRVFDIEPDARTVAEIMVDEDTAAAEYEPLSAKRALVFVEYEKAAARALRRLRLDRRSA